MSQQVQLHPAAAAYQTCQAYSQHLPPYACSSHADQLFSLVLYSRITHSNSQIHFEICWWSPIAVISMHIISKSKMQMYNITVLVLPADVNVDKSNIFKALYCHFPITIFHCQDIMLLTETFLFLFMCPFVLSYVDWIQP